MTQTYTEQWEIFSLDGVSFPGYSLPQTEGWKRYTLTCSQAYSEVNWHKPSMIYINSHRNNTFCEAMCIGGDELHCTWQVIGIGQDAHLVQAEAEKLIDQVPGLTWLSRTLSYIRVDRQWESPFSPDAEVSLGLSQELAASVVVNLSEIKSSAEDSVDLTVPGTYFDAELASLIRDHPRFEAMARKKGQISSKAVEWELRVSSEMIEITLLLYLRLMSKLTFEVMMTT